MSAAPRTVSAVIPVHNGARFLSEALRSVRAQTRPVDELIVVDDGSTDGSAGIVRREAPEAILIRQAQSGAAAARNAGARRAHGDALAFLDHDDLWPPDRTSLLLDAWAAHPEADVVCGAFRFPGGAPDARLDRAEGRPTPILFSSLLIRRSCWLDEGGMRSAQEYAEDTDLHLRLVESGARIVTTDAVTLLYRMHGDNQSRHVERSSAALLFALRAAVLRRRERTAP